MRDYILFDLDGTLTDPKEGITKSVQYALAHYGIQVDDLDSLIPFIGPPLMDSFKKFYGFQPDRAREGVLVYREYFTEKGWCENKVFPGIVQMLEELRKAGKKLYVATSKPEVFALKILKHFELLEYFDGVGGADLEEKRSRKADVISYLLERERIPFYTQEERKNILMVGDREHDVLGAAQEGLDCVGVLYGYGSPRELEESGAFALAGSVEELKNLLLKL